MGDLRGTAPGFSFTGDDMKPPMTPEQVRTAWGMLVIFALIVGVDAWLFFACARTLSERWPAFTVAVSVGAGLLLGHAFL